jgi:hypothetical protein
LNLGATAVEAESGPFLEKLNFLNVSVKNKEADYITRDSE